MEKLPGTWTKSTLIALGAIIAFGIFLRVWPSSGFRGVGYDEHVYATYVAETTKEGLWNYRSVINAYLTAQEKRADAVAPPTRVAFLWPAAAWSKITGIDARAALHHISILSSILLLLGTCVIGFRLGDSTRAIILTALVAVAPLQIHLAQRSLADGYFALWAVLSAWFLWERLQAPHAKGWLTGYGVSLFLLVLTKENAAFVVAALVCVIFVFTALRLARLDWPLLLVSLVVPALAVCYLAFLVGGLGKWIAFYQMFAAKSQQLDYAVRFQNGPWYRYLVDFTLLSPCIVALAFGQIFQIRREAKADVFWALLLLFSFVFMSSVSNGMSLRFAAYWDLPLRWLAASQLTLLATRFARVRPPLFLASSLVILAFVDLSQYWRYFVHGGIYDPVSIQLMHHFLGP